MEYMWNISLSHHQVADMFIVCGVLYAVDHVDLRDTKIRFALDLYKNKLLDVDLPFTNPFRFTTSLGYNPRLKVDRWKMLLLSFNVVACVPFSQSLTTWDEGNQLTYPLKYHDIGYKEEDEKEEAEATGYQVHSTQDTGLQIIDFPQKSQQGGGGR